MSGTWASGWITGDVVTAAEFAKGAGAIYNTTLGAPAANIDATGIIDDYAALLIIAFLGSDTAATSNVGLRLNNDTGANYDRQYVAGNAATASASEGIAATSMFVGNVDSDLGASPSMILIPNYASTALGHKPVLGLAGLKTAASTGGLSVYAVFGSWRSTAAINRITLLPVSGNFATGSRLTIYGLGA